MQHAKAVKFLVTADAVMATVIERVGPCQLETSSGDLLACLTETIIHQQLSTRVAATIHQRFLQLFPNGAPLSPQAILATSEEAFRSAGLSRAKITYIKDLAQKVQAGLPTLEDLENLEDGEIIKLLTQIKGIGPWSVHMLLIFRMSRLNVLPVDDLGLRSAIQRAYGLEALPDKKQVKQLGDRWQPYCSIASWYLWRSLEQ